MIIKTPHGNAVINDKGYPRLTSGARRHAYLHRVVFEVVAGRPVREGAHVHHMNGKLCWCPESLVELDSVLHPGTAPPRCPYTNRIISKDEYKRIVGCD
jgi:hypothetical protein